MASPFELGGLFGSLEAGRPAQGIPVIPASLTQIQSLLLRRQGLAEVWKSRHDEMPMMLNQAFTGCMVIFSCLEAEKFSVRCDFILDSDLTALEPPKTRPSGLHLCIHQRWPQTLPVYNRTSAPLPPLSTRPPRQGVCYCLSKAERRYRELRPGALPM